MTELVLPDRILIVQDDEPIRVVLERALGRQRIITAGDGLAGLEALLREQPGLVMVDLDLPDLSGADFITQVRKTSFGACVPLLVLAPAGEEERLLECFEQGADDFIVRPLSVGELRVRASSLHLSRKFAREAHPVTGLPTGPVIRARIADRLSAKLPFAIAYVDIDNFKSFNDSRGFDVGDQVLRMVAKLLCDLADEDHNGFVGHVADDDFVMLLNPDSVEAFAEKLHARFDESMSAIYTERELEEKTVEVVDRRAEIRKVPLMSLSIAVVTTERPGLDDVRKIEHIADEVTKMAKAQPGNSLFIERRKNSPA